MYSLYKQRRKKINAYLTKGLKKPHLNTQTMMGVVLILLLILIYFFFKQKDKEPDLAGEINKFSTSETIIDPRNTQAPTLYKLPSQILNLTNWKLTLPIGQSEKPLEIEHPKLETYNIDPWFVATEDQRAVRFRAPVNGVTTNGSDYSRSELREMSGNRIKANWSSSEGVHEMLLDQAVTSVPKIKKDVVVGQIHDGDKDIIVIRLNYPNLHIRVDGKDVFTLDSDYILGERFKIKFIVKDNLTEVYYNDSAEPVFTLNKKYDKSYFKAGIYTQSNCSKEKSYCNSDNFGEVLIYNVSLTHQ